MTDRATPRGSVSTSFSLEPPPKKRRSYARISLEILVSFLARLETVLPPYCSPREANVRGQHRFTEVCKQL